MHADVQRRGVLQNLTQGVVVVVETVKKKKNTNTQHEGDCEITAIKIICHTG